MVPHIQARSSIDPCLRRRRQDGFEVTNATESTWGTIKADFEKAYAGLKDGFAQSRQWLSDKIAP